MAEIKYCCFNFIFLNIKNNKNILKLINKMNQMIIYELNH